jgi:TPR repeat protein
MTLSVKDCRWPWNELLVLENGDVKPCCYAVFPIGNLDRDPSLQGHWEGQKLAEIRQAITEDRIHAVCAGAACSYVKAAIPDYVLQSQSVYDTEIKVGIVAGSLAKLARLGHRDAMTDVAFGSYNAGLIDDALLWFKRAAGAGSPLAHFWLGYLHLDVLSDGRRDIAAALEHLQKASAGGYGPASTRLGVYYAFGSANPDDHRRGLAQLQLGAEQGDAAAWHCIAQCHRWGIGAAADGAEYRRHLGLAARRGHEPARRELAALDSQSSGENSAVSDDELIPRIVYRDDVPEEISSAGIRKLALLGHGHALADLGHSYFKAGRIDDAIIWFSRAAEAGSALAHFWLGYLYLDVVEENRRDTPKALMHLRKSSEEGFGPASARLGVYLVFESGDSGDDAPGLELLRRGADQGDAPASYYLAQCYRWGRGVAADEQEYRRHLGIAAQRGHKVPGEELTKLKARNVRDQTDKAKSGQELNQRGAA